MVINRGIGSFFWHSREGYAGTDPGGGAGGHFKRWEKTSRECARMRHVLALKDWSTTVVGRPISEMVTFPALYKGFWKAMYQMKA